MFMLNAIIYGTYELIHCIPEYVYSHKNKKRYTLSKTVIIHKISKCLEIYAKLKMYSHWPIEMTYSQELDLLPKYRRELAVLTQH